jgi:BirA family biotin operon repressor/biotin-[acetyl-CoA-carboxylase] ligase
MIGRPHVHHRLTDSTNERAKELARAGAPHGTLVTADAQSAGRGRQGRAWTAPPASAILMSAVVRGLDERHALLPLAAALAACEASEAIVPVECAIKWPNDVWIDGRKLAGILIEGRPQEGWAVVGVGLNVLTAEEDFPEELRATATSLRAHANEPPSVDAVLDTLLDALDRRLADEPATVLASWRERDALRGRHVRWRDGEGTAAGVDETGALLVETGDGEVALDAGEVHLLR